MKPKKNMYKNLNLTEMTVKLCTFVSLSCVLSIFLFMNGCLGTEPNIVGKITIIVAILGGFAMVAYSTKVP